MTRFHLRALTPPDKESLQPFLRLLQDLHRLLIDKEMSCTIRIRNLIRCKLLLRNKTTPDPIDIMSLSQRRRCENQDGDIEDWMGGFGGVYTLFTIVLNVDCSARAILQIHSAKQPER